MLSKINDSWMMVLENFIEKYCDKTTCDIAPTYPLLRYSYVVWSQVENNSDEIKNTINSKAKKSFEWWRIVSRNEIIDMDFVNNNLNKPWVWREMCYNKNLTMEMIFNNVDKSWNWYKLKRETFGREKQKYTNAMVKWIVLLQIYKYYDQTIISKMGDLEIVFYDIYLVKQIINF